MGRALNVVLALLLTGCGSACGNAGPAATGTERGRPEPEAPEVPAPPGPAEACTLRATPMQAPALPPDLLAVAPQYFHPSHRGGFDAYRGRGNVFPWFDLFDLATPVRPPAGARVAASTAGTLLLVSRSGELGVLRRGESAPSWLGLRLYPTDVVETASGDLFLLARSGAGLRLVHLAGAAAPGVRDIGLSESGRDARLVLTRDDRPVLAWVAREEGRLRALVSWSLDPADVAVVDEVEVPVMLAELSARTGTDLSAAADGDGGIAVAWRPLTDAAYTGFGSASEPPTTPAGAEVRWRTIAPDGDRSELHRHDTRAQPLPAVTGVGPWPLAGNGMNAGRLGERAVFAWLEGNAILGALASDDAPVRLASVERAPFIGLRPHPEGLAMLLLDSSPNAQAYVLACE